MSKTTKASRLLSRYIREIANEAVMPLEDADAENGIRMATRAEALARKLWQMAEGYSENIDGKIKVHAPDKAMIAVLLDRMEGRVPTIDAKDQKPKASVAERVGDQSRNRMNASIKQTDDGTTG